MTDVSEDITAGLAEVFQEVVSAWEHIDYDPILDRLTEQLEVHHGDHFALEHSPSDELWPDLAISTQQKKGHDRKLFEFGDLITSLMSETTDSVRNRAADGDGAELIYGTSDFKSRWHQDGTPNIPQREHVGMSELFTEEVEFETTEFIIQALRD